MCLDVQSKTARFHDLQIGNSSLIYSHLSFIFINASLWLECVYNIHCICLQFVFFSWLKSNGMTVVDCHLAIESHLPSISVRQYIHWSPVKSLILSVISLRGRVCTHKRCTRRDIAFCELSQCLFVSNPFPWPHHHHQVLWSRHAETLFLSLPHAHLHNFFVLGTLLNWQRTSNIGSLESDSSITIPSVSYHLATLVHTHKHISPSSFFWRVLKRLSAICRTFIDL